MQYKQRRSKPVEGLFKISWLLFLFVPVAGFAQTTYLPQGAKENVLLERMEIKAQTDSVLNFSKTKPYSRQEFIPALQRVASSMPLSKVDAFNLYTAQASNIEYADNRDSLKSKRLFWKSFYKTPANFFEVNQKDFHLIVNPVFQYYLGKESASSEKIFLNTRGVTLRGTIANKIGFAAYITDNQERDPTYVQNWVTERHAVPGEGFYKDFKGTGYDYFDARGYISFKAAKYIDIVFGYDKNFIGNGYRSLFLSDFSNSALFLKLNTRIWKFNYQNIFMELVNANRKRADIYLDKKYAAVHHLDMAVAKWLNVGLFEAIVFGRPNHFEFGYLNPVIFYRSIEQQSGSLDNSLAGLDAKANLAKHVQLYGQLLLDELRVHELKNNWWGNKFGYQLGGKYIDAFGVSNLDLQGEWNRVRPFTYSHTDSIANWTHNNQPLAHPYGASFNEFIGLARYQPIPRLMLEAKAIYYKQGKDTSAANYGSNIFQPATLRPVSEYGYSIGSPVSTNVKYASLLVSYELKPNFFVELNAVRRTQDAYYTTPAQSTTVFYFGVRWNMHRRNFEF
ncbi:capsule assembly Wzi family protein [Flavisolibacter ginsenosidimutans]|uniref:capsule assembly Wzi family protein n=1 Tax=Flavisolibacter ginsenosidimutans TaxID=661481 RepID=UPI001D14AEDC|nr:capsule assembly Wzi family protein [Flavisolibacter ginsenosidimutans]